MPSAQSTTLAEVVRRLPAECYENPTWKGLAWFARDVALYAALVTALVTFDSLWLLVPLWIVTGLAISALFILGHDAAHGALFKSGKLNHWIGQAAMLPSLHLFEAWVLGHNRVHHGHTTREVMDYVWHPVTPEQYGALSRTGKLAHRIKWSWLGAGVYYGHEIWWQKMIWNFEPPKRSHMPVQRDRWIVGSYAALASGALLAAGAWSYGSAAGALWMWVKVFAVPFVVWNYSIGIAVYVHHICEDIPWHKRRDWNKYLGQVKGTTVIYVPAWANFFYHNIFLHVPHHVDMRIPFYGLPLATRALREQYGDEIVVRAFGLRDYLETTRSCKLFDFDAGRWQPYPEGLRDAIAKAA